MIYVCIPSHNEAPTVGLLLWKIRQVFSAFEREYQLLVGDDASTDATSEVLQPYTRALPLTVVRSAERLGYARTMENLLRLAVDRTDRPKRDCAIVMHADFAHQPHFIPDMVRHIDGGADVVVGEGGAVGEASRGLRLLRRWAPVLLRSKVGVPGVNDIVSGFLAFRLIVLRNALRNARNSGHLTPVLAGNLALELNEDPTPWMALAVLEGEKASPAKDMLMKRLGAQARKL